MSETVKETYSAADVEALKRKVEALKHLNDIKNLKAEYEKP